MTREFLVSALVSRQASGTQMAYGHRAARVDATSEEEAKGWAVDQWVVDGYRLESIDIATLTRPAPKAEPVGWRVKDFADGWIVSGNRELVDEAREAGHLVQPLYTHPPQAVTVSREVARKLVAEYRETMPADVMHLWAKDVVAALKDQSNEG